MRLFRWIPAAGAGTLLMTLSDRRVMAAGGDTLTKEPASPLMPLLIVGIVLLVMAAVGVTIAVVIHQKRKKARNMPVTFPVSSLVPKNYTEMINVEIRKHDPDFIGAKFCDWCKNILIRVLGSISERHPQELRSLETAELYRRHEQEINDLLSDGQKKVYEHIVINRAYLQLYVREHQTEKLTVYLHGLMQHYLANAVTGERVGRYSAERQEFKYLLTFQRSVNAKTILVNGVQAMICQNCGAPVEDVSDIRCRYCDSELRTSESNWILSDITAMTDDSPVDDNGIIVIDRPEGREE